MISVPLRDESGGTLAGRFDDPLDDPLTGPLIGLLAGPPSASGRICVPRSETAPRCEAGDGEREEGGPWLSPSRTSLGIGRAPPLSGSPRLELGGPAAALPALTLSGPGL